MQVQVYFLLATAFLGASDAGIVTLEEEVTPGPPRPYSFAYVAGRYPGHVDRKHSEASDGTGIVHGSFSYVDPRHQVRTVEYVADKSGFHPVLSLPVADTPTVAAAKQRHADLYERIAADHARIAAERAALDSDNHVTNY